MGIAQRMHTGMSALESDSIVTICGSGEATEEIVIVSGSMAPDNCGELSITGVLFLMGLFSGGECSTQKTSESVDEFGERFRCIVMKDLIKF